MNDEVLTTEQAAAFFHIGEKTFRKAMSTLAVETNYTYDSKGKYGG